MQGLQPIFGCILNWLLLGLAFVARSKLRQCMSCGQKQDPARKDYALKAVAVSLGIGNFIATNLRSTERVGWLIDWLIDWLMWKRYFGNLKFCQAERLGWLALGFYRMFGKNPGRGGFGIGGSNLHFPSVFIRTVAVSEGMGVPCNSYRHSWEVIRRQKIHLVDLGGCRKWGDTFWHPNGFSKYFFKRQRCFQTAW